MGREEFRVEEGTKTFENSSFPSPLLKLGGKGKESDVLPSTFSNTDYQYTDALNKQDLSLLKYEKGHSNESVHATP